MTYLVLITRNADVPELGHVSKGSKHIVGDGLKAYLVKRGWGVVVEEIPDPAPVKPTKAERMVAHAPAVESKDTVTGTLEPVKLESGKK